MRSLHLVLASAPDPEPIASTDAFWQRHRAVALLEPLSIDQAILGGFSADRVGFAFASGYQAALRALVPDLPHDKVASLCVTERGGGHPRAIETRLEPDPSAGGSYRLTGKKRWATLSGEAGILLVAASTGVDETGKNLLRLVRVDSAAPGVRRQPMPEPPFTPELGHDEVELLPRRGDGGRRPARRRVRPLRAPLPHNRGRPRHRRALRVPDPRDPPPRPAHGPLRPLRRAPSRAPRARRSGPERARRPRRARGRARASPVVRSTSSTASGAGPNRRRTRAGSATGCCSRWRAACESGAGRARGSASPSRAARWRSRRGAQGRGSRAVAARCTPR